jgi:hypothetical protein
MIFKCPVCKEKHIVNDKYDNSDFICQNTGRTQKTFQDLVPETQLTNNQFNMNRSSTLVDENRPATIINIKPEYRPTGEKIGQLKKNY